MILDRYILLEFTKPFFFSAFVFALVIQVGHLFDRLEVFLRNQVPVRVIALYLLGMLPLWMVQALPICTLIAAVLALGNMARTGELFCLRSSGIASRRIVRPLFLAAGLLTLATFILGDTLMPAATSYAKSLYRIHVDKVGPQKPVWGDIVVLASHKRRITAKVLDLPRRSMDTVTVEEYGDHFDLRQALTAQHAEWSPEKGWTFYDGVVRLFSKEGDEIVEEEPFASAQLLLPERPEDMVPSRVLPEELSSRQLREYIRKVNGLGLPALTERVQFHLKFAFPFTHLLVLAIGIPIAFRTTQSGGGRGQANFGRTRSLAVALAVGFAYLMLITLGQALGESRKLEPWMGVWIANVLFLGIGIALLRKLDSA